MSRSGFQIPLSVACLVAAFALDARAQSVSFRRGDANGDARVDVADAAFQVRVLFLAEPSLCRDAEDTDDNGVTNVSDPVRTANFLFVPGAPIPGPWPAVCAEDPSADDLGCASYTACSDPAPLVPDDRFKLRFSAPFAVAGESGEQVQFAAVVEMCNAVELDGWSFGVRVEPGSPCSVVAVTTSGTSVDMETFGSGNFDWSETIDPDQNGGLGGAVASFVTSFRGRRTLPATDNWGAGCTSPHSLLHLTLEATVPEDGCLPCTLAFAEGLLGTGQPIPLRVAVAGQSAVPGSLQDASIQVCEGEVPPEFANVVFQLGGTTGFPGGPVSVPFAVKADGPSQGFSYSIDFDEELLSYESTEKLWSRPSGTAYDFERFEVDAGNGFLVGAALISLTDTADVLPPTILTEVLAFHLRVNPLAEAGTETSLVFAGGGQGTGGPVPNKVIAGGRDVTPATADSFVFVNGLIGIVGDISAFIRGDSDGNETLNIADPQTTLNYLFLGSRPPVCFDAADANDDGDFDMSDPIATLQHLFLGSYVLPPPNGAPGADPTADDMTCGVDGT